jgi:hypothetical protein
VNWERSIIWHQHWVTWRQIGLGEEYATTWKRYIDILKDSNVRIREDDDQLVWSLNPIGTYVPKIGYKALVEEGREEQHVWWWKIIWKLNIPSKNKFSCG